MPDQNNKKTDATFTPRRFAFIKKQREKIRAKFNFFFWDFIERSLLWPLEKIAFALLAVSMVLTGILFKYHYDLYNHAKQKQFSNHKTK